VIIGTVSHGLNLRENNHEDPVTGQPVDGAVWKLFGVTQTVHACRGLKVSISNGHLR